MEVGVVEVVVHRAGAARAGAAVRPRLGLSSCAALTGGVVVGIKSKGNGFRHIRILANKMSAIHHRVSVVRSSFYRTSYASTVLGVVIFILMRSCFRCPVSP